MNLYEVTNGWTGESYVKVFVIAANEEQARYIAADKYRTIPQYAQDDMKLNVELLCEDTSGTWVSEPRDY